MNKKEHMFSLVAQWRKSGITRKAFAVQHGFKSESFNYWCKRQYNEVEKVSSPLKSSSQRSQPEMSDFIELTSTLNAKPRQQEIRMELELPGGIYLRIY